MFNIDSKGHIKGEAMKVGQTITREDGRVLEIRDSGDPDYPFALVDTDTGKEFTRLSYLTSYRDMYFHFGVDLSREEKTDDEVFSEMLQGIVG